MNAKKILSKVVSYVICFGLLIAVVTLFLSPTAFAVSNSDFEIVDGVLVSYSGKGGKVVVPDGVTKIDDHVFGFNKKVNSVVFPDSLKVIGKYAFSGTNIKSLVFPNSLEEIDDSAFESCSKLSKIELPDSLRRIGDQAFAICHAISSIHLPSGLEQIGVRAFMDTPKLKEFTVAESNPFFTASDGVLYTKDLETLVKYPQAKKGKNFAIPEGVKRIGAYAFNGIKQLDTLILPESLVEFEKYALMFVPLKEIILDEENQYFSIVDGALLTKDKQTLIAYPAASKAKEYSLPEEVKTIGVGAFCDNQNLTYVFMKNGNLISIEEMAFYSSEKIVHPVIPEGVEYIGDRAFQFSKGLKSVQLPSTLRYIGANAFCFCTNLSKVESISILFDSPDVCLEYIGDYAFDVTKVYDFTIPRSVEYIGHEAFEKKAILKVYSNSYGYQYARDNGYAYGVFVE